MKTTITAFSRLSNESSQSLMSLLLNLLRRLIPSSLLLRAGSCHRSNWVSLYKRHEHKERDKLEAEGKYRWEMKSSINSIFTLNNAVRRWGVRMRIHDTFSRQPESDIRYMSAENWTQYTQNSSENLFNSISSLRHPPEALYMLTSTAKQRFEFIFTDYGNHANHFNALFDVYKAYQASVLYRELKLRSGVLSEGKLNILPQEQILRTVNGAYNLSSDQGNLGCFIITNVRLVWFADLNHSFNISLPYMQMVSIKLRESKYGLALVIATAATAGNYGKHEHHNGT